MYIYIFAGARVGTILARKWLAGTRVEAILARKRLAGARVGAILARKSVAAARVWATLARIQPGWTRKSIAAAEVGATSSKSARLDSHWVASRNPENSSGLIGPLPGTRKVSLALALAPQSALQYWIMKQSRLDVASISRGFESISTSRLGSNQRSTT